MSDSDSEFEKFLQESVSSSLESSFSNLKKSSHCEETGLKWLKSPSLPLDQDKHEFVEEEDEWIADLPEGKTSRRRMSTASEDPLNFSTGSGYSILSEIEHHLGLRGSKSPPPGQDTINEEDEKRNFFEQFEKGRGSSLDYSELNKQLSDTLATTERNKGTITLDKVLEAVDEDSTPHISENELEQEIELPSFKVKTAVSSHSSLSSSSHHSTFLSSNHSISSKHSPSKLAPLLEIPSGTRQRRINQASVSPNQSNRVVIGQTSLTSFEAPPTSNFENIHSTSTHSVTLPQVSSNTKSEKSEPVYPSNQQNTDRQENAKIDLVEIPNTSSQSNVIDSMLNSSSSSSQPNISPSLTQLSTANIISQTSASNIVVTMPNITSIAPSASEPFTSTVTNVPVVSSSEIDMGKASKDRSLDELLRVLAVEELTTLSQDMLASNNDKLPPGGPVAVEPSTNDILHQQEIDRWKLELEREKDKVKEMEDQIKERIRKEEKMQLEYGRQMQDLRKQVLEQRAMLRRIEEEKKKLLVNSENTDERETLIQGYQKENERLYNELSITSKELKSTKSKQLEDNNRLATELANARLKCETQDKVIRSLRQQLDTHPYLLQEDDARVKMIEEKLEESQHNCKQLETQIQQLLHSKQTLEKQLMSLKSNKSSDYVPVEELEEVKQKYEEKIKMLQEKVKNLQESQKNCKDKNDVLLQEIEMLKGMQGKEDSSDKSKKGPRLIKSRTAADLRRIKELEHQVNELQTALKKRHPNSIPALIYATSVKENESKDVVSYLEKKVQRLEKELAGQESEILSRLDDMRKQFQDMETIYEQQVESLKEQLTVAERKAKQQSQKENTSSFKKEDNLESMKIENAKLNDQISQLSLEVTHQRLQLEAIAAEAEGEKRKLNEKWEKRVKKLEKEQAEKMDALVVNLIQERSDSNITRLKTRLMARESRIKQLEEELEIARIDGETLAVSRTLEEDLRNQIDILTRELEESKKHHTPEMHHFNSLLAKIGHLENKLSEYQKQMQEAKGKSGQVSRDQLKNIELKYRKQLTEKNKQIEKFREELDTLMDTLHSLQESSEVIKR